jgi:hypothetical protein
MARSRRQGRTLLYPAFPPLTALASPGKKALRKARLECACLVSKLIGNFKHQLQNVARQQTIWFSQRRFQSILVARCTCRSTLMTFCTDKPWSGSVWNLRQFTYVGHVIQSSPLTAVTLAVIETTSRLFPHRDGEVHCLGSFQPDRYQSRRYR